MFFDQFDKLTGAIYQASREATLWPEVLRQICEVMGCTSGSFWMLSPRNAELNTTCFWGQTEEAHQEYREKWLSQDPWMLRLDRFPSAEGVFSPSNSVISDAELEATEVYQGYLGPHGLHYGGGSWISRRAELESFLTVIRPKSAGPLTDHELSMGTRIVGHIRQSVAMLEARLEALRGCAGLRVCFESLPYGVAILDSDGRILDQNKGFKKLVAKCKGLELSGDRLMVEDGGAVRPERWLRSFAIPRSRRGTPLWVTVRPILAAEKHPVGMPRLAAIMEIRDPERRASADSGHLEALFGLTPSEARFTCQLAGGMSVKEAAETLGIAEQTGRTHLKRAMSKTGTKRQAELMGRVSSLD